jgi:hypothetical protein
VNVNGSGAGSQPVPGFVSVDDGSVVRYLGPT